MIIQIILSNTLLYNYVSLFKTTAETQTRLRRRVGPTADSWTKSRRSFITVFGQRLLVLLIEPSAAALQYVTSQRAIVTVQLST